MNAQFVYTEVEIAAVLRVAPEAVRAWLRRGDLRPIALTSDGRSLFAAGDVEAIGRRLAAAENIRELRPVLPRRAPRNGAQAHRTKS
jgi:MerR-like DNA binding protein